MDESRGLKAEQRGCNSQAAPENALLRVSSQIPRDGDTPRKDKQSALKLSR